MLTIIKKEYQEVIKNFIKKVFAFIIPFWLISLASAESTLQKAEYITPQEIRQWQAEKKEFIFVDVRRTDEFEAGHLPDAINIPYDELNKRKKELPEGLPVVFYCTYSSWRAPYAANLLKDFGHEAYVLEGGASGWNAGGQIIYSSHAQQKPKIVPKPKDLQANFNHFPKREYKTKINLTQKQLREFDGKDGRPAYIAIRGVIYDVTQSRLWRGGEHDPSHGKVVAGRDLTDILEQSPHGDKHLKYFSVVGKLIEEKN